MTSEEEEGRRNEYRYDLLNRQTYVRTLDGKEQENFYDGEGLRAGLTENGKKKCTDLTILCSIGYCGIINAKRKG